MGPAISHSHALDGNRLALVVVDGGEHFFVGRMHDVGAEPSLQLGRRRVAGVIAEV